MLFIRISTLIILFIPFSTLCLVSTAAIAADVTLAWNANTESDLAGYQVYYGTSSGNYTNSKDVGNTTQYTISNLQEGVTYYITATAYDIAGNESSYSTELVHTVGTPNNNPSTPSVPTGPASGVTQTDYSFSTTASDPDSDPLEYRFDWGDGAISNWGSSSQSHAWSSSGNFCATAQARDTHGAVSGWSSCQDINIARDNQPPVANAGADQTVFINDTVRLNGGGSSDVDGDTLSFRWSLASVPGASKAALYNASAVNPTFVVDVAGTYTVQLIVNDGTVDSQPDTVTISTENSAPVAIAGADQQVEEGTIVALSGLISTDPDGNITNYSWEQIAGSTVILSKTDEAETTFIAPNVGTANETLTFKLTVTDSQSFQDTDTCSVHVKQAGTQDSDNDGVPDDLDAFPMDSNEWIDTDDDGEGNNVDPDDDNDGMPDIWEIQYGLDPFKDDAGQDPDADGVNNLNEYLGGTEPNMFDDLSKPDQPRILYPSAGEIVPRMPVLETDYFADPDATDTHGATEWQLFRTQDRVCVFDKISSSSLTALVVPKLVLDENTAYEWRVKFIDNHGIASEWSEMGTFTTDYNDADADGNGITDDQEVDPALDLDEDGTPDNDQSDIKCVGIEGGSTQIGISIRDADTVQSIVAVEAENLDEIDSSSHLLDQPSNLQYGLISFKLIVNEPGDEVVVKLHLSHSAPLNGIWYKYDSVDDIWLDYSAYTDFSADRKTVYLTIFDGGFGDADGIANGIIVDPLGLSVPSSVAAPDAASAVGGGGGGSGAGCFIGSSQNHMSNRSSAVWHNIGKLEIAWTLLLLLFVSGQWGPLYEIRVKLCIYFHSFMTKTS